jgi:Zn-dependent peptidase ImmA (M78 family)/transcriptional regulator with XRE-family HTH domain
MSKADLHKATQISLRTLTNYEDKESDVRPRYDHLQSLASALKLPVEFFYGSDIEEITSDAVSFRSLSKLPASQRDAALAAGTFAKELCTWIEQRFALPKPSIPSLRGFETPEAAAEALRAEWGLGEKPINNTVHLLEVHGVRVFSLPVDSRKVDAFSLWHGDKPFVFLNPKKTAEHGRFDAAHELGHLAMHTHSVPRNREAELEADRFASAFLMPRGDVFGHVPPPVTISLKTVHRLKKRWGVSAMALVHRLHKLNIIREWQYRNFVIGLSSAGYRTSEKDSEIERDTSQIFAKVFATLRAEGTTRSMIARDLAFTTAEIDSLLVGLVMALVPNLESNVIPITPPPSVTRPASKFKLKAVPK